MSRGCAVRYIYYRDGADESGCGVSARADGVLSRERDSRT